MTVELAVKCDGLEFLSTLPRGCASMVYLDPPFGHGHFIGDEGSLAISLLKEALPVIQQSGIVYLHCDPELLWAVAQSRVVARPTGVIAWKNGWVSGFKSKSTRFWPRQYQTIIGWAGPDWRWQAVHDESRAGKPRRGSDRPTNPVFSDWWETPNPVDQCSFSKEKLGWPTQKPVELLKRLIFGSTPGGGLVVDPSCGSGTSRRAAEQTGRRWMGCDIDQHAVDLANGKVAHAQ